MISKVSGGGENFRRQIRQLQEENAKRQKETVEAQHQLDELEKKIAGINQDVADLDKIHDLENEIGNLPDMAVSADAAGFRPAPMPIRRTERGEPGATEAFAADASSEPDSSTNRGLARRGPSALVRRYLSGGAMGTHKATAPRAPASGPGPGLPSPQRRLVVDGEENEVSFDRLRARRQGLLAPE